MLLVLSIGMGSCVSAFADTNTTDSSDNSDSSTDSSDDSDGSQTLSRESSDGSANGIISTYINMASGKNMSGSLNNVKFTKGQMRFLGVYASNYFIPFSTEFGEAGNDSESTKSSMEAIKKILQEKLKFSDSYADTFAEEIVGLARSSATSLKMAVSEEYQKGYVVSDGDDAPEASYYNFLTCMMGKGSDVLGAYGINVSAKSDIVEANNKKDIGNDIGGVKKAYTDGKVKYIYFGYTKGGEFVPVADCVVDGSSTTAFQAAFMKCLESSNIEEGYGLNGIDLTKDEIKEKGLDSDLSDEKSLDLSIMGMDMMVDCYGDILIYGLQHQIVAVPGCVNPYTWCAVDKDGNDYLRVGEAYQMINIPSLADADGGTLFSKIRTSEASNSADSSSSDTGSSGSNSGECKNNMAMSLGIKEVNNMCKYNKSNVLKALNTIVRECGGGSSAKFVYNTDDKFKNNPILLNGKYSDILKIDSSKINSRFKINSVKQDVSTMEGALSYLCTNKKKDGVTYSGTTPFKLNKVFGELVDTATSQSKAISNGSSNSNSNSNSATSPDTDTLLKDMKPAFKVFKEKSSKVSENGKYTLRLHRNTTGTNAGGVVFNKKKYSDIMVKANSGLNSKNKYDRAYFLMEGNVEKMSKSYWKVRGPVDGTVPTSYIPVCDVMFMIDNLGTYNWGDSEQDVDYQAFNAVNYIGDDDKPKFGSKVDWEYGGNTFAAGYTNTLDGTMTAPEATESAVVSIFTSYLFAGLYSRDDIEKQNSIGKLGYRMAEDNLPNIPDEALNISSAAKSSAMLQDIRNWLYYLLHPTEGIDYFRILIRNKMNGVLLGWHNDMLGTNGVGVITGTTRYRNTTGYVTCPDLSEIQWTDALINVYENAIPFLIVLMLITMLFTYITGILSVQHAIIGFLLFSVCLFLPVNTINGAVEISNKVSTRLYGDKFTYWALVQQETYATEIDNAANGGGSSTSSDNEDGDSSDSSSDSDSGSSNNEGYQNYLRTLYAENAQAYSNQGSESIVLRWQAPKKMASLMFTGEDKKKENSLSEGGKQFLNAFMDNSFKGESYTDDTDATYLFRSYLDISNFSRYIYKGLQEKTKPRYSDYNDSSISNFSGTYKSTYSDISKKYSYDRKDGYTNMNKGGKSELKDTIRLVTPTSSKIVNDALSKRGKLDTLTVKGYTGLNQDLFSFSIPMFTQKNLKFTKVISDNKKEGNDELDKLLSKYKKDEDYSGLASYALYSENVFYYFSWYLYDCGLVPSSDSKEGYKELLLGDDGAGFFYNIKGNGELKDFMDMKSLFTYIIPYLKEGNDLVHEWDDLYGIFFYDGVPTEEGHQKDKAITKSKELKQKYWHNLNVARLYSLYTPWVDVMYECSYAKPETIRVLGDKFTVEDPLNPASYPDSRPMVFSRSEMYDYGLDMGDLTKAERIIIKCNDKMQERMFELLNYYNFSDVTLDTAAAMNCAFIFNNYFSQNGIFSSNHNIYPQTFELSDFSYDAFLRFILSNTTGDSLVSKSTTDSRYTEEDVGIDFYRDIINNSSWTTGIVMILLDILAMYIVPAFRIFFIIAVFLLSIMIIVVTAFKVDTEQKFITKLVEGLIKPMLYFLIATVGFAYVVSLFMGNGNTAVTNTNKVSIAMGDPVVVMLAMLVINGGVLVIYFNIIRGVVSNLLKEFRLAGSFVSGVVGSVGGMITGALVGNALARGNVNTGGSNFVSDKNGNAQAGTGVASDRAQVRASKSVRHSDGSDYDDMSENKIRQNDARHTPIKNVDTSSKNEKNRAKDVDSKIEKGMKSVNRGTFDDDSTSFRSDFIRSRTNVVKDNNETKKRNS